MEVQSRLKYAHEIHGCVQRTVCVRMHLLPPKRPQGGKAASVAVDAIVVAAPVVVDVIVNTPPRTAFAIGAAVVLTQRKRRRPKQVPIIRYCP